MEMVLRVIVMMLMNARLEKILVMCTQYALTQRLDSLANAIMGMWVMDLKGIVMMLMNARLELTIVTKTPNARTQKAVLNVIVKTVTGVNIFLISYC